MKELIEVFRMAELDPTLRAKIIIQLGKGVNHQMGMNVTEPVVYELVKILDPQNPILHDTQFLRMAGQY